MILLKTVLNRIETEKQLEVGGIMTGGPVGRAGHWMASYVPGRHERRERLNRNEAERVEAVERARQRAGQTPDQKATSGNNTTDFNKAFIEAIRRGQSRTDVTGTPDMLIRETICNERFVQAIASAAVRTPLEENDVDYARSMARRREELAGHLNAARTNRRHMIGNLSTHDLDIIYSTMMRMPQIWDGPNWQNGTPRPPEVFMRFLEAVAQRKSSGKEGEFIGMVVKDLSTKRTFTDSKEIVQATLLDSDYASTYLYRRSAEPLERAVEEFSGLVTTILTTQTSDMTPTVNMPGLGYNAEYARARETREQQVSRLHQVIGELQDNADAATRTRTTAEGDIRNHIDGFRVARDDAVREEQRLMADPAAGEPERQAATRNRERTEREYNRIVDQAEGRARLVDPLLTQQFGIIQQANIDETNARADLEMAQREHRESQVELERFTSEASTAAATRQVVDHFRALLIEHKEAGADLKGVADRIAERLPNVVVTAFLDRAQEFLVEKEELAQYLRQPAPVAAVVGQPVQPQPVRPDYATILQPRVADFTARLAAFELDMGTAQLPDVTRNRLRMIASALREMEVTKEFVEVQLRETRNNHAFPLRRAALNVVERMNQRNYETLIGLSDAQRLEAVRVWESTSEIDNPVTRGESGWTRFKQRLAYHTLSGRGWRQKGRKVWDHTIGNDINYLRHEPTGRVMSRDHTEDGHGAYYPTIWPRWARGVAGLAVKGVVLTVLGGNMLGQEQLSLNPLSWPSPIVHALGGPVYVESRDWYRPWSWLMPVEAQKEVRRVIHDSYDIPDRLAKRGTEYYRSAYGVGQKLPDEKDDVSAQARLSWLQSRKDVLVFLQERKTMKVVTEVKDLGDERGANCSTSTSPVPGTCKTLGVETVEQVQAYQPVEPDKWKPGMKVCCTIELGYNAISDGLRLNTHQTDRFVALLMAEEAKGVKISYEYLNSPENRARWAQTGFLVSELENQVMTATNVYDLSNVQFLLSQGKGTAELRLAMGKVGDARYHVVEQNRDAFLNLLRENIVREAAKVQQTVNPVMESVPNEVLTVALQTTMETATAQGWVKNTEVEFQRKSVEKELGGLKLSQASLDICVVQTDVKQLLLEFTSAASPYRLNVDRSDEFVRMVVEHKKAGGKTTDYSPAAYGPRVNGAVGSGLMVQISEPAPQATLTTDSLQQDGQAFFTGNRIGGKIDSVLESLLADTGADGTAVNGVLTSRFTGNKEQLSGAVKARWYRELSTAAQNPTVQGSLKSVGITVTKTETGFDVTVDYSRAEQVIRSMTLTYVRDLNPK
ncbi:Uncharacterised protein [Candidatus Bilamarchaeum dharawalense]|uniref:Uncharacterized protein n=1 Tax=Candidatus Bilamarchaeum dharawalense TaxID=2885759 RepID=A0A5E4LMS7_9ARCH|nr:Uncharacterised protein [Candidatus Bilamarchaeum dharawalense]